MNKKKQFFRKPIVESKKCNCGKTLFAKTRTNYPFGRGSKGVKSKFYKCSECGFRSN